MVVNQVRQTLTNADVTSLWHHCHPRYIIVNLCFCCFFSLVRISRTCLSSTVLVVACVVTATHRLWGVFKHLFRCVQVDVKHEVLAVTFPSERCDATRMSCDIFLTLYVSVFCEVYWRLFFWFFENVKLCVKNYMQISLFTIRDGLWGQHVFICKICATTFE